MNILGKSNSSLAVSRDHLKRGLNYEVNQLSTVVCVLGNVQLPGYRCWLSAG